MSIQSENQGGICGRTVRACAAMLVLFGALGAGQVLEQTAEGFNRWPGWRGDGSGISKARDLPTYWDAKQGIAWKTAIPGQGNSSPIIWDGKVFLTSATPDGAKRMVLCLDAAGGAILWNREIPSAQVPQTDPKNGYASATPVTDGQKVYAFFDGVGLVAVDFAGNLVWTAPFGPFQTSWSLASSPALCGDTVIVVCDHDGPGLIAAVDKTSGKVRWQTPRPAGRGFGSPAVISVKGADQIVVNGKTIFGYDPADGKALWSVVCPTAPGDMVVPTAVFDEGIVYAVSGRNGPVFAIDPTGRGDISETHARMLSNTGGPYIPSPVIYPYLFVPGDNGAIRIMDPAGKVVLRHRLRGHFSASPTAGDGKIYWANEAGETFVFDAGHLRDENPALTVLAVNPLGEPCLASPAVADGRIFQRTDKHLFCIAGAANPSAAPAEKPPAGDLAALVEEYRKHPVNSGPDVAVRLRVVEAVAAIKDPEAIRFLLESAQKEEQWDVAEAACKSVAAQGRPAVPALITLLGQHQSFARIIAADALGSLQAEEAVEPLLTQTLALPDPMVKIAALGALAKIAAAHEVQVAKVVPAMVAALKDERGAVKEAAMDSLVVLAGKIGPMEESVMKELRNVAGDKNPAVAGKAAAAIEALRSGAGGAGPGAAADQPKSAAGETLRAGPIRLQFADGELRYLYVGQKEIVRRIYFAVRDSRWDTVMPVFTEVNVKQEAESFRIRLRAVCKSDLADYRWTGEIVGTAEGRITFRVTGEAAADFPSPRIGLCVLYGAESLAGQTFETADAKGAAAAGKFPEFIATGLVATAFERLRYTTADGLVVSCSLEGAAFDMEDQRNYGDSSYKAFSAMPYGPNVAKGRQASETLVLEVSGARPAAAADGPVRITIDKAAPAAKMPRLLAASDSTGRPSLSGFLELNQKRDTLKEAAAVAFPYNPAAHMPDDDTFMENRSAVVDQVRTIRAFAPRAAIRIGPITINSPYPRPGPDPRQKTLFVASWAAGLVKYLALAGVDEAVFQLEPGPADTLLREMSALAGRPVLAATVIAAGRPPIEAWAVRDEGRLIVWLSNNTPEAQKAVLANPGEGGTVTVWRLTDDAAAKAGPVEQPATMAADGLEIELAPFEVGRVTLRKAD
ncbi:MAG TPA: PQQ-binding-like beta-propeller repeat protein [Phycisphaerae bacterium]|nr:PQQ-binding-like beta-propeller repeat protein [Phycisphaerae bacterium]